MQRFTLTRSLLVSLALSAASTAIAGPFESALLNLGNTRKPAMVAQAKKQLEALATAGQLTDGQIEQIKDKELKGQIRALSVEGRLAAKIDPSHRKAYAKGSAALDTMITSAGKTTDIARSLKDDPVLGGQASNIGRALVRSTANLRQIKLDLLTALQDPTPNQRTLDRLDMQMEREDNAIAALTSDLKDLVEEKKRLETATRSGSPTSEASAKHELETLRHQIEVDRQAADDEFAAADDLESTVHLSPSDPHETAALRARLASLRTGAGRLRAAVNAASSSTRVPALDGGVWAGQAVPRSAWGASSSAASSSTHVPASGSRGLWDTSAVSARPPSGAASSSIHVPASAPRGTGDPSAARPHAGGSLDW